MFTGYRHVQLRSSSNQPLDLSTLFVCCKLEDDSWGVHTAADAAATSELRGGVDAAWPVKKTSARSGAGSTVVRPRDDRQSVSISRRQRGSFEPNNTTILTFHILAVVCWNFSEYSSSKSLRAVVLRFILSLSLSLPNLFSSLYLTIHTFDDLYLITKPF